MGQKTLTQEQTILIDSIGGNSEYAWWGSVAPALKAVHYKSPPCIVLKQDEDGTENIDREKVLSLGRG